MFWYVNQHLETVIRQRIPSIIALINKTIDELNAELDHIGRPVGVDGGVITGIYVKSFFLLMKILFFPVLLTREILPLSAGSTVHNFGNVSCI